jgi:hypothetical protein
MSGATSKTSDAPAPLNRKCLLSNSLHKMGSTAHMRVGEQEQQHGMPP